MKKTIGSLFSAAMLLAASLQAQAQTISDSVVQITADIAKIGAFRLKILCQIMNPDF